MLLEAFRAIFDRKSGDATLFLYPRREQIVKAADKYRIQARPVSKANYLQSECQHLLPGCTNLEPAVTRARAAVKRADAKRQNSTLATQERHSCPPSRSEVVSDVVAEPHEDIVLTQRFTTTKLDIA